MLNKLNDSCKSGNHQDCQHIEKKLDEIIQVNVNKINAVNIFISLHRYNCYT